MEFVESVQTASMISLGGSVTYIDNGVTLLGTRFGTFLAFPRTVTGTHFVVTKPSFFQGVQDAKGSLIHGAFDQNIDIIGKSTLLLHLCLL